MGGAEDDEVDDDDEEEEEDGTGAVSVEEEEEPISHLGGRMACLGGGWKSLEEALDAGLGSGTNRTPTDPVRVLDSSSSGVCRGSVLLWMLSENGRTFCPMSDELFWRTGLMSCSD